MSVFNKIVKILFYPLRLICYALIYFYKFCISPILPKSCKFYPTCSSYMLLAIKEWGIIKGIWLGIKRLIKCNPINKSHGIDNVPINIKGDHKWVF